MKTDFMEEMTFELTLNSYVGMSGRRFQAEGIT